MIRASSFLFRTLATTRAGSAATRSGSVASFAVPNRFLQTAHYGSSTAAGARTAVVGWFFGILGATVVVIDFTVGPPPFHDYTNDTVLYQCETCPISTQVRVFLDYYDIPYKVIEVNPISKKEIKWSEYRDLPILIVDGKQLNGSSAIIDSLGQKILSKQNTNSTSEDGEETKWQKWADNRLVHLLEPNMYRTASEALESLDYIMSNGNYNSAEKIVNYVGAATFHFMFNSVKQKYNIADERAALYEAAETWVVALNGQEFLGGSKPNLADMAVFGVLRPIRYLRCGKDMVEHTRIGEWYTRMENAVGKSSRIEV